MLSSSSSIPSSYSLCIYKGTHVCLLSDDIRESVIGYPLDLVSHMFDSIHEVESSILLKNPPHSIPKEEYSTILAMDFYDTFDRESRYGHGIFKQIHTSSALVQCPTRNTGGSTKTMDRIVSSLCQAITDEFSRTIVSIVSVENQMGSFQVLRSHPNGTETTLYISGAYGGYLVADFASFHGHGGYEQILFLPGYNNSLVEQREEPMKLLEMYLEYCVLTDGTHILYCGTHVNVEPTNGRVHVQLKMVPGIISNASTRNQLFKQKRKREENNLDLSDHALSTRTPRQGEEKPWQQKLRQVMERQLERENQRQRKKQNIHILEKKLIQMSQRSLVRLSLMKKIPTERNDYDVNLPILDIVRLRYVTEPSHSNRILNTSRQGVQIHLEVDLNYNWSKKSAESKGYSQLTDVQLCAMPKCYENESKIQISTNSCVVPSFHPGDCFRLSALIHVADIQLDHNRSGVKIYLGVFFRYLGETEMTGSILGSLTLPAMDLIRLRNDGVFKEVSVENSSSISEKSIDPSVYFEYRIPKVLVMNSSQSCSNALQIRLQELCDSFNDNLAPRQRVDLQMDHIQQKAHLSFFAPTPEERSMLLSLVHEQFPEDVHIEGERGNIVTKEYAQSCFFEAAKSELKTLYNYIVDQNQPLSSTDIDMAKLSAAQSMTNDAFERLSKNQ